MTSSRVTATAPGRVNLIGDHTDYSGGLALPMAIDLTTTVTGDRGGTTISLTSDQFAEPATFALPVEDLSSVSPPWARIVAAVTAEVASDSGFIGSVTSTVPMGHGLSSSAALEVAVALAVGAPRPPTEVALLCQRAETAATGVRCGVMDQLCATSGTAGHALLMDCATLDLTAVPLPEDVSVWVVPSGERRTLAGSAYGERRDQCAAAERLVGPLPSAGLAAIDAIENPVLRARARHVRTECDRVRAMADALTTGDLILAGALMAASHRSLCEDFEVSTRALDRTVQRLGATAGVFGARLTGAGFGGCVVALADPRVSLDGWRVRACSGATVVESG